MIVRIEDVDHLAVYLDGPRYPDIALERRVESSGDRGLAVAGGARDEQASSGVGHHPEQLERGLGQDEVGKSGSDGFVIDRGPVRFLTLYHGTVRAEGDRRGA